MVRLTYSSMRRQKNKIYACFSLLFIYYIFFTSTSGEGNQSRGPQINHQRAERNDLWTIFNEFESHPRPAKSRAFSYCSDGLGGDWGQASIDEFAMEHISGGSKNQIYKCSLKSYNVKPVILKIMFSSSKGDKARESAFANIMSEAEVGPKILAEFEGGRIEEYLEGRTMTKKETNSKDLAAKLGAKIAKVHSLNTKKNPDMKSETDNQLTKRLSHFLDLIIRSENTIISLNPTVNFSEAPSEVTVGQLAQEIDQVENYITKHFKFPISLIHNDFFEGNIIIGNEGQLTFVDFENSMYGHRAADIVSYLTDFGTSPYHVIDSNPNEPQTNFLHGYIYQIYELHKDHDEIQRLKLTGDLEGDTAQLIREAKLFWPIWNLFWGLEHLVAYIEGNHRAGDKELYMNRLAAYFTFKSF